MTTPLMEAVLVCGEDDWVPLLAIDGFARQLKLVDPEERRIAVLTTIRTLLNENLVEAGDLGNGPFQPWDQSPISSLARVAQNYLVGSQDIWGFDAWFRNTAKGNAAALIVIADEERAAAGDVENSTNRVQDCATARTKFPELTGDVLELRPFVHSGALDEAVFVDSRFDAIRGVAMVLLDMRCSLLHKTGNTAVVVAHGVERFGWERRDEVTPRHSWSVVNTEYHAGKASGDLEIEFWSPLGASLRLTAQNFEVWFGDTAGLREIPDLGEADDLTVTRGYPRWDAEFIPVAYAASGEGVAESSQSLDEQVTAHTLERASDTPRQERSWRRGRRRR